MGLLGSSDRSRNAGPVEPTAEEIAELRNDFRRYRTPIYAADLVDAALVTGRREIGSEAAEFLIGCDVAERTQLLAHAVLVPDTTGISKLEPPELTRAERCMRIARARRQLRAAPRDPIRLVDLAREYAVLAQNDPAERALRRALALAPENRFVLRSAARFYLHRRAPDLAHRLLRRAAATKVDPWLLAAEIMMDDGAFAPRDTSELASALGTIELTHGNRRKLRKYFERALLDPTENTVAQAGWVARHVPGFSPNVGSIAVPRAFEARAWSMAMSGDTRNQSTEPGNGYGMSLSQRGQRCLAPGWLQPRLRTTSPRSDLPRPVGQRTRTIPTSWPNSCFATRASASWAQRSSFSAIWRTHSGLIPAIAPRRSGGRFWQRIVG